MSWISEHVLHAIPVHVAFWILGGVIFLISGITPEHWVANIISNLPWISIEGARLFMVAPGGIVVAIGLYFYLNPPAPPPHIPPALTVSPSPTTAAAIGSAQASVVQEIKVIIISSTESLPDDVTSFSGNATTITITTFTRNVGDYWEAPDRRIKIAIVDIKKSSLRRYSSVEEEDVVQLNVNTGGGIVHGGEKTTNVSVNTYLLPVCVTREEFSILLLL